MMVSNKDGHRSLCSYFSLIVLVCVYAGVWAHPRLDQTEIFSIRVENANKRVAVVFDRRKCREESWIALFYSSKRNFSCADNQHKLKTIEGIQRISALDLKNTKLDLNNCDSITCLNYYENMSYGFYCAQIIRSYPADCSNLYTPTVELKNGFEDPVPMPVSSDPPFPPLSVLWFFITATFVAIIALVFYKYFRSNESTSVRQSTVSKRPHQADKSDLTLLNTSTNNKIFIVYHRDDEQHFNMVVNLVQLIRTLLQWEVIVDYDCREEIATLGITVWVTNAICNCSKIVVISSTKSHALIESIVHGNRRPMAPSDNPTTESIFMFAWRNISSNYDLCFNYNKVFNVRFRSTNKLYITPKIVPHRHYVIPTHLTTLVSHLKTESDTAVDINMLQNIIKSTPYYAELVAAVLPNVYDANALRDSEGSDEIWISPGS